LSENGINGRPNKGQSGAFPFLALTSVQLWITGPTSQGIKAKSGPLKGLGEDAALLAAQFFRIMPISGRRISQDNHWEYQLTY
jgi:hypothetical protein